MANPHHRDAIVRAAADLFRRQGYAASGISEILSESGAPRGSFYHYFPAGKEQVAVEVVRAATRLVEGTLVDLLDSADAPGSVLRRYGRLLSGWMAESGFRDGGPVTTILLELAPEVEDVTAAGRKAFDAWRSVISGTMIDAGVESVLAHKLATLAIAALEGSLVLARVEQDGRSIIESLDLVAEMVDAACAEHARD